MGIADMFGKDDRIEIKVSDLYEFMKQAAEGELIQELAMCEPNKLKAGDIMQKLANYRKANDNE